MPAVPSGTVTFLFTDIEGSTTRWEQHPEAMRAALVRHDALLHEGIAAHDGVVITERGEGDSFFALFARPSDALAAACTLQRALAAEPWLEAVSPIRVRMALHTGEAGLWEGRDYRGAAVNRCARLRAVAHGGQVLLSGATYELVRDALPPGVTLRDLGEHRLKDLTRPEHIFQVVIPDLPADFPSLKTLDQHRHNLPVQLTPFIGREREVAAVRARLLEPQTHLLTLTGPGGTGKTRLALQIAAEVLDAFPDGVFFVDLASLSDPALVLPTIAQTLGVVEQGAVPLSETLRGRLHGTQTLLVLDNFEQVIEAAPDTLALLEHAADVRLLVTSRVVLQVPGEREYPVPPLALPDLEHLPPLESLTQYEAVRLFMTRAQDVQPDFALTEETASAVAETCVRLDGLPLAIELAAARIRVLPPPALLARLDHRLTLVAGGARTRPTRQQTLRATIDWSYHLLTPDEQQLFAGLGVFVGGATLEAMEAVWTFTDIGGVLAGVESLITKSLLRAAEGVAHEPRFRMLETIHEYARERLEASTAAEDLRRQHAAYYLALAEQAAPAHGVTPNTLWLDRLQQEHGNMRAALDWAHDRGEVELEARLALALSEFWQVRAYLHEGRERLEHLLALQRHPERVVAAHLHLRLLFYQAVMSWRLGDYERAVPLIEEGLALARAWNEPQGVARFLEALTLTVLAREQGDYERAAALAQEYRTLAHEIGDPWEMAIALQVWGEVAWIQGHASEAERALEASLRLYRRIGDQWQEAYALNSLGQVAVLQQDVPRAAALFDESLSVFREMGALVNVAMVLYNVGRVARMQGAVEQARAALRESLALAQRGGSLPTVANALEGLAGLEGEPQAERAARLFGAAQAVREAKHLAREQPLQSQYEQDTAAVRRVLGEEPYARAWAEGHSLLLEQAIAYALEEGPAPQQEPATRSYGT